MAKGVMVGEGESEAFPRWGEVWLAMMQQPMANRLRNSAKFRK